MTSPLLCLVCRYWRATHGLCCEACALDLPAVHARRVEGDTPIPRVSHGPRPGAAPSAGAPGRGNHQP